MGTVWGIGQRRPDIPPDHYIAVMKLEVIGQGVCIFNIDISKAAVSFLLLCIVTRALHKTFVLFCLTSYYLFSTTSTLVSKSQS